MEKLNKIQIELKALKDKKNDFGKYSYRNIEAVLAELKPILQKYNCHLKMTNDLIQMGNNTFIKTIATFVDIDNGYEETATAFAAIDMTHKGMSLDQCTGAATTYCNKYCLNNLFLIDDGSSDPDAQEPKDYDGQQSNQPKKVDFADIDKINSLDELEKWYRENEPLLKTENQKNAVIKKCGYRKKMLMQGNIIVPNKDLEYND